VIERRRELELRGKRPRYARDLIWGTKEDVISPAARYSFYAEPLPRPPPSVFQNSAAAETIHNHPELFKIICNINVDAFKSLLIDHPNPSFVQSVVDGLLEGFWPLADIPKHYPETWDNPIREPRTERERDFLRTQIDKEVAVNRFSPSFGPNLLPGMYSPPIHAAPRTQDDKLRLVVNHSYGEYSLNSMISRDDITGVRLDGLHAFGASLLAFRKHNPSVPLIMWKADVKAAYRQMPMHPFWQILQVVSAFDERRVDRCNNFGGRASQKIWASFCSLVLWIAVFKRNLTSLKCYVDDNYSFAKEGDLSYYAPYKKFMPSDQVKLLLLWDEINLPHDEEKQVSGPIITCIGFDIDPNAMTVVMSPDRRQALVDTCVQFIRVGARRSLRDFQSLQGHINWSLNVYPKLRPALCASYAKTAGKSEPNGLIRVNNDMRRELSWFVAHVRNSDGVHLLKSVEWSPTDSNQTTLVAYVDASGVGIGIWFPGEYVGYQCRLPDNAPRDVIFFFEALAVCSAVHLSRAFAKTSRLVVYTDNTNAFDIFTSLRAQPCYNRILISAMDVLIEDDRDLRVFHVPGKDNIVADPLSRFLNELALKLAPLLEIRTFIPPRDALGEVKK
jgi:hypothetical protein